METRFAHEAVPGHQLQIARALELDMPKFRRGMSYVAYVEGWALYAETLRDQLGLYAPPVQSFRSPAVAHLPRRAAGGRHRLAALRDKAKAALGERFDIRRFHTAALDTGAVPLPVLEQQIDEWIIEERQ